jgi:hypothetical protein
LLSNNPLNVKKIKTGAMMLLLTELSEHDEASINQTASIILDNLADCVNGEDVVEPSSSISAPVAPAPPATPAKRSATYLNTIVLSIPSLGNSAAMGVRVDKLLVTQSGIVSVSIDHAQNRATIYSSAYSKDTCGPILMVLDNAGFKASVYEPAPLASATAAVKANKENSGYLDASQFANASVGATPRKGGSLAMAVYREANEDSSLQARVARKQTADKLQEQKQQSLVGRLSSWFW